MATYSTNTRLATSMGGIGSHLSIDAWDAPNMSSNIAEVKTHGEPHLDPRTLEAV